MDRETVIRIANRADLPRIGEIRMAVSENRLSRPEKIVDTVEWLIDRDGFWVFEEAGSILGFSSADPRDGQGLADDRDRNARRTVLPAERLDPEWAHRRWPDHFREGAAGRGLMRSVWPADGSGANLAS